MLEFGDVLLHVYTSNADGALLAVGLHVEMPANGDGHVVLGDLVALHQVGVGVILPVELGAGGDGAVEGEAGGDGVFDGLLVDDGKDAGHSQTNGAYKGVGLCALVVRPAGAEHLAPGL